MEYAVLNVPGFKILKGSNGNWIRIHTGEKATTPYQNTHRWWLGITDYEVAEYISLKSKIKYWAPRQKKRDFNPLKFAQYKDSLGQLLEEYDESEIIIKITNYKWCNEFLPQAAKDMFVF